MGFNPLNAELNPICHLLALLGGATIVVVSRLRVNSVFERLNRRLGVSQSSSGHFGVEITYMGDHRYHVNSEWKVLRI